MLIIVLAGPAPCRCRPLSSNVRRTQNQVFHALPAGSPQSSRARPKGAGALAAFAGWRRCLWRAAWVGLPGAARQVNLAACRLLRHFITTAINVGMRGPQQIRITPHDEWRAFQFCPFGNDRSFASVSSGKFTGYA